MARRQRGTLPLVPPASHPSLTSEIRLIDTQANLDRLLPLLRQAFTVVSVSHPKKSRAPGQLRVYVTVLIPVDPPATEVPSF